MVVEEHDADSAIIRRVPPVGDLLGLLADGPGSVGMEDWEDEKRRERALEARKAQRWGQALDPPPRQRRLSRRAAG